MNFNEFYDFISSYPSNKIVILGLGNPHRRDDGAGLYLLKKLKAHEKLKDIHFIAAGRTPENYLQQILSCSPQLVIFIDMLRNSASDQIQLLDSDSIAGDGFTTHSYSIRLVEKYLKNHNKINIKYLGVPAANTETGPGISPDIKNNIAHFLNN
jgi:hydrogenase maturation protease